MLCNTWYAREGGVPVIFFDSDSIISNEIPFRMDKILFYIFGYS